MENSDSQTPFGAGFSRGLAGAVYQPQFDCPQAEQKYQLGYQAGKERYNRRFNDFKIAEQQTAE
jgi:hypothetical protein